MDLRTYLAALRKSWLLIVLVTVLGAGLGTLACALTPRSYASTVDFYVSTPRTEGTSAQSGGQFAESRVSSYIVLLSSEQLAQRVISSTRVQLAPLALAREVSATTELNTVIVTATVTDPAPARSLQIAQGLAVQFPRLVDALDNQGVAGAIVAINVVSGPTLESGPVAPSAKRYVGLGLAAGLVLGLALALLRRALDTSVHDVEEAQRLVGAPVIGTIAHDPGTRKAPLIVGPAASSVRAESYRQLRTNLRFISAARSADVILVTSSMPLEGKTTTAVNLALTFTELGERVLLVEGDLRRPKVAECLDLPAGLGLTDVLTGQAQLDEVIQPWGDDGLFLLASGTTPPNPSELLGSPGMAEVVDTLKGRFDKIVIDSPPVLPVTDAVVASSLAQAVVFVVRHGRTSRAQASAAALALRSVDAPLVGCVLNGKAQNRVERRSYGNVGYATVARPAAPAVYVAARAAEPEPAGTVGWTETATLDDQSPRRESSALPSGS